MRVKRTEGLRGFRVVVEDVAKRQREVDGVSMTCDDPQLHKPRIARSCA
jgi:hypothetical protein